MQIQHTINYILVLLDTYTRRLHSFFYIKTCGVIYDVYTIGLGMVYACHTIHCQWFALVSVMMAVAAGKEMFAITVQSYTGSGTVAIHKKNA